MIALGKVSKETKGTPTGQVFDSGPTRKLN